MLKLRKMEDKEKNVKEARGKQCAHTFHPQQKF